MDNEAWLGALRKLADEVETAVQPHLGREAEGLGTGAGGDVVFPLDRVAEDAAMEVLEEIGDLRLVSEEAGVVEYGDPCATVVLDPVDGSHNAKSGIPFHAVSVAKGPEDASLGDLTVGVVRNLATGREYAAVRGGGATLDGEPTGVSETVEDFTACVELWPPWKVVDTEPPFWERAVRVMKAARRTRSLGSLSLELCLVGCGALDTYVNVTGAARTLDMAAGVLIVEEAGGVVTDDRGEGIGDLPATVEAATHLVATGAGTLHEEILEMLG